MDTSKEYIEMCEKAEEIQNHFYLQLGKHFSYYMDNVMAIANKQLLAYGFRNPVVFKTEEEKKEYVKCNIWLPRFDQYAQLTEEKNLTGIKIISALKNWYSYSEDKVPENASLEMLHLCFYMYNKHRKVYDFQVKKWLEMKKERHIETLLKK